MAESTDSPLGWDGNLIKHSVTGGTPGKGERETESVSGLTYFLKDATSGSEEVRMLAVTFGKIRLVKKK